MTGPGRRPAPWKRGASESAETQRGASSLQEEPRRCTARSGGAGGGRRCGPGRRCEAAAELAGAACALIAPDRCSREQFVYGGNEEGRVVDSWSYWT